MTRSTVATTTARLVVPTALLLAAYLLFAGHDRPGGGFVGGLVAGAAIAVHFVSGGVRAVDRFVRVPPRLVLAAGLLLAAGAAIAPLVFGAPVLDAAHTEIDLPVLGGIGLDSTLVFDAGVFAVVVGLVAMVFEAFGDEEAGS